MNKLRLLTVLSVPQFLLEIINGSFLNFTCPKNDKVYLGASHRKLRNTYILKNGNIECDGFNCSITTKCLQMINRQFPLWTNFKTRQGDANKSPQLERAY